jgi:hypothetical protein
MQPGIAHGAALSALADGRRDGRSMDYRLWKSMDEKGLDSGTAYCHGEQGYGVTTGIRRGFLAYE